ncbi:NADH-quinone oxidoreductase subunit M [Buchnera aphidicola (Diuraphis noxia)]|uniref:NADH-quinone oxidoreductase subunit M n=1 Tax=Buchnera aphidicola subsp. Diuraphis noxia TaxID=118101 RepID=A0A1B2H857_BUCDN|nr:NuoM family protein [Buchnera aphidicola]ANZ22395.1 NADH-quinone oxidoreductase subunit M [Buchnera aphidicola (Diuraphis noxia)]
MLLSLLIIIPFFSSLFAFFSYKLHKNIPRWIALSGILLTLLVAIQIFLQKHYFFIENSNFHNWSSEFQIPWIPTLGIEFNIAIDGFSIVMLIFSCILSFIAILCSWNEIKNHQGFFYFNFMLVLTATIGIFIAIDLFLFFFFWEIVLIPMYFLISLWGNAPQRDKKHFTENKFFIYGQISGLILLASILLLVFTYYENTHVLTFNYNILLTQSINKHIEYLVMLGFFIAFAIKMPIVPFHSWLPNVHSKSTYCGSVEIIGLLLKTAPYAILRYNLVLFPYSTEIFTSIAMFLGLISMFYGAFLAFSQSNLKKLIAYSSISHMGLILIGIYSNSAIALQGVIIQILSNSVSTTALCILSGQLYKRIKTQDISQMSGIWSFVYWIPGFALFFSLANLGIPGTGNFIGEFLILSGIFSNFPYICIFAVIGIVFSSIYSLSMIQRIFYGSDKKKLTVDFTTKQELSIMLALVLMLIFLGTNPQKIINISYSFIHSIQKK